MFLFDTGILKRKVFIYGKNKKRPLENLLFQIQFLSIKKSYKKTRNDLLKVFQHHIDFSLFFLTAHYQLVDLRILRYILVTLKRHICIGTHLSYLPNFPRKSVGLA